jgi:hypothetical protein
MPRPACLLLLLLSSRPTSVMRPTTNSNRRSILHGEWWRISSHEVALPVLRFHMCLSPSALPPHFLLAHAIPAKIPAPSEEREEEFCRGQRS